MSRLLRLVTAAFFGCLVLAAAPAYAADGASIDHVEPGDGTVEVLVSVPGDGAVDLSTVTVTLDGADADATAKSADTSDIRRTAILAIDTSTSMKGSRFTEAKKAARAYLAAVPANVYVGVVAFDGKVRVAQPPSLDRAAATKVVNALRLDQDTALNDGVLRSLRAAGTSGQRTVLVLSDGKDTTTTPLAQVVSRIKSSGARVEVVSLGQSGDALAPLQDMATAGGGAVISASDPAALTRTFADEADLLSRQVLVTASVPDSIHGNDASLVVAIDAAGQTYTANAFARVRTAPPVAKPAAAAAEPIPLDQALEIPKPLMFGAVGAIGVGLIGVIIALAFTGEPKTRPSSVEQQIAAYGVRGDAGRTGTRGSGIGDQARQVAEKALSSNRSLEARIARRLEAAGMAVKPAEWLLIHGGILIGLGLLGALLGAGNPLLIVVCLALGLVGPWVFLGLKRSRRVKAFNAGLADTLQLMAGSLSAGLSLAQSVDTIVDEGSEPITSEFKRVIVESRLGVTIEDAMEGVAERMGSRDFHWVVMAIRIQREVGGNLAELLLQVAETLREREYLRRHVSALSAEGRLSCWILGALPPVFLLYLVLTKYDYVEPMFTTALGWLMVVGMSVLLAVGVFWMSKVAKVNL